MYLDYINSVSGAARFRLALSHRGAQIKWIRIIRPGGHEREKMIFSERIPYQAKLTSREPSRNDARPSGLSIPLRESWTTLRRLF